MVLLRKLAADRHSSPNHVIVAQNLRADTSPERCEVSEHKEIVPLAYYNSACWCNNLVIFKQLWCTSYKISISV
ncbi:hypothetical protein PI124_g12146 [Phytophthora idaei]|nr:hypothetical protein PI124_g12146 [Phytophthora idaei]